MILQALHQLALDEDLVEDLDYEWKRIAYLVVVGPGGQFLGFRSTKVAPPQKAGSRRSPKPIAKRFPVPREPTRTSGARAFFCYDKAEYALGQDPEPDPAKRRAPDKLEERFQLFQKRLEDCYTATSDEAVGAVVQLLQNIGQGSQPIELPEDCAPNDLFAFSYHQDAGLLHDRPAIQQYWKAQRSEADGEGEKGFICLVTGEPAGQPANHPQLKVPGGMSSGVALVSFNARAFESHGWKGNENAPVSREAAETYATALRRLLDPAPPNPHQSGETLPRRNIGLSSDTTLCYWDSGADSGFTNDFADLLGANEERVESLFHSIWQGRAPDLSPEEAKDFYGLILTGSQGRVIVRSWFQTTIPKAAENLAAHFRDLEVVANTPPPKNGSLPPAVPLYRLLESIAVRGKRENIPSHLSTQLVEAAIHGRPYPLNLLQRALQRARAEVQADSWADLARRDARAALIKAVLIRHYRQEISAVLDPENTQPGYVLGRLMAVLERLQQTALGDVNTTIVDRYFSSASATPRRTFIRLLQGSQHHARKAEKEGGKQKRKAIYLKNLLDKIVTDLDPQDDGIPARLNLQQQGLFVLGYHQQRHDLRYKKREEKLKTDSEIASFMLGSKTTNDKESS